MIKFVSGIPFDKSLFLRVTKLEEIRIPRDIREVIEDNNERLYFRYLNNKRAPNDFGTLSEVCRTSKIMAVLKLWPYSKDMNINDTIYETRVEALDAAIKFLGKGGYSTKPFDFEGMIERA